METDAEKAAPVPTIRFGGSRGANPLANLKRLGYEEIKLIRGRKSGWYFLAADVEGKRAALLIDTGAAPNALDPHWTMEYAPSLLRSKPGGEAIKRTSLVVDDRRLYPTLAIGKIDVPRIPFVLHDLSGSVFPVDGLESCSGILGAPFLRYYSAIIDYGSDRIYLLDPAKVEAGLQGEWRGTHVELDDRTGAIPPHAGTKLTICGCNATFESSKVQLKGSVYLNLKTDPKQVDLVTAKGYTIPCVYSLNGETLVVAGQLFADMRYEFGRPLDFKAHKGNPTAVITFKRGDK